MAHGARLSYGALDAAVNAVAALANSGRLAIYGGARPSSPNEGITGQVKLAELAFNDPAFLSALMGEALANPLLPASAVATGIASWFRVVTAGGSPIFDGTVAESDADLILSSTDIHIGAQVTVSSFTYTQVAR